MEWKKISNQALRFGLFTSGLLLLSACNPLDRLFDQVRQYGYIPFTTPMQNTGPGTLIGGKPNRLALIASAETCFPREVDGIATDLLRVDSTTLPTRKLRLSFKNETLFRLFEYLSGGPQIAAGINFNVVHGMDLTLKGATIHFLDSVAISQFHQEFMPDLCKSYLEQVGFVIQAIKVESLEFKLYDRSGGTINLSVEGVEEILDIGDNVEWEVENETSLIINQPSYLGYQLGKLRIEDRGMVLYRASQTRSNRFIFRPVNIFDKQFDPKLAFEVGGKDFKMSIEDSPNFLKEIKE